MPLNSTPPLSQPVILALIHRLASAIGEAPSVDEDFGTILQWLRRAASAMNPFDPIISLYVPRVLPSVQQTLNSAKQQLMIFPGDPRMPDAARTITGVQEILSGRSPSTHPAQMEEWDDSYLAVLGTQDLGQLRGLLTRSDPEVVMPLNATPPLSQAVILTLIHRLAVAVGEAPSVDGTFPSTLWWLQRAASTLDPSDRLISPYVRRVLPSVEKTLNSTKRRLLHGDPRMVGAAGTITDVQEILDGKIYSPFQPGALLGPSIRY